MESSRKAPPVHHIGVLIWALATVATAAAPATAQVLSARRMAMGGVILSNGGEGSAQNVAYRAVPPGDEPRHIPLPLGLLQFAVDPPVFDTGDPDFNAFELADALLNPPWHVQLYDPAPPSGDVVVSIARDTLVVELDDLKRLFPDETMTTGGSLRFPGLDLGFGPAFAGVSSFTEVTNDLTLDPALHAALAESGPIVGGTRYAASQSGRAQAFASIFGGAALPLLRPLGDSPYEPDAVALYGGARLKYLVGIGYADAQHAVGFTTQDTLFGGEPVNADLEGVVRGTASDDLFHGRGFGMDLGAALFVHGFEFGLGVNDLVHAVTWRVDVDTVRVDPATNDVTTIPGPRDTRIDGAFPVSWNASIAYRAARDWTVAATLLRTVGDPEVHVGAEKWLGLVALRAGSFLDTMRQIQGSAGAGVRLGGLGLDLGLSTHSRTLTEERGLEMGLSLSLYGAGR